MTIPNTARKAGPLLGTGSQTAWPFTFKVFSASDVAVTIANSAGVETVLVLNTDYSVALNSNQETSPGGTVTYPITGSPLPVGSVLAIVGDLDYDQSLDIPSGGNFSPLALENQLDRTTMQIQQLKEAVDRAAKLPTTSSEDATALVADIVRLADSADNLDVVAPSIDNVNTVAANIASVNSAATNMAAIIAAPSQAASAAASAAAAAASAVSGMYSAVQDKSANYTVVAADAGDLIRVNTSGGARTITLPAISSVSDGFKLAVVKWTGDLNQVTIARSGSDTINGATSATITAQYSQVVLVADFETNQWFASTSGMGATNIFVERFSGTGAQVAYTLSGDPGTINNTYVFVSGVYQQKNTYSLSGATLTFNTAPPAATDNIEVVWAQPLAVGVPSDLSISTAKLIDAAVTPQKLDRAYAALAAAQSFTAAQRGTVVALTDGATITPNFALGNNFSVTLGGNRTLANPTNLTAGQHGTIVITQDGTGSRTLAYGGNWKFPSGAAPTLTTTASAVDVLAYYVESATRITARLIGDVK